MRKVLLPIIIAVILFFVPFFWLKPGFVDLGGDSGRLYFLDPLSSVLRMYNNHTPVGVTLYAFIPYEFFLYCIKLIVQSPTLLISFERGLQLSLSFISIYAIASFLSSSIVAGCLSGLVYLAYIASTGWVQSLEIHNQVFLNPLLFFLLFRYCLTKNFLYVISALCITIVFSGNFGYSATPQILSFFPLAFICLFFIVTKIFKKTFPWRGLGIGFIFFLGLHAFHWVPTAMTIADSNSSVHGSIFKVALSQPTGVQYFEANKDIYGKISRQLFQPTLFGNQNAFHVIIPLVIVAAFFYAPTRLLGFFGLFYACTLFLTSANITNIGAWFYKELFYIPGFAMFRSFWEKWYFVHSFFTAVVFGISFSILSKNVKRWVTMLSAVLLIIVMVYTMRFFLRGEMIRTPLFQSDVSAVFAIDADLLEAVSYAKSISNEERFLTLPLTFAYTQIAYGEKGGAYVGVSLISALAGKQDFSGFWRFEQAGVAQEMFDALRAEDIQNVLEIFAKLNIRYVFRNSDPRIMNNFPGYPYVYPGMMYSSKEQIPLIKDQKAYDEFLDMLPLAKKFEKGFYTIYEIDYPSSLPPIKPQVYTALDPYFLAGRTISMITLFTLLVFTIKLFMKKNYEIA